MSALGNPDRPLPPRSPLSGAAAERGPASGAVAHDKLNKRELAKKVAKGVAVMPFKGTVFLITRVRGVSAAPQRLRSLTVLLRGGVADGQACFQVPRARHLPRDAGSPAQDEAQEEEEKADEFRTDNFFLGGRRDGSHRGTTVQMGQLREGLAKTMVRAVGAGPAGVLRQPEEEELPRYYPPVGAPRTALRFRCAPHASIYVCSARRPALLLCSLIPRNFRGSFDDFRRALSGWVGRAQESVVTISRRSPLRFVLDTESYGVFYLRAACAEQRSQWIRGIQRSCAMHRQLISREDRHHEGRPTSSAMATASSAVTDKRTHGNNGNNGGSEVTDPPAPAVLDDGDLSDEVGHLLTCLVGGLGQFL
jgi:hypothetical protein